MIKIEERTGGDLGRGVVATGGKAFASVQRNPYFEIGDMQQEERRRFDLRKEKGRDIVYRLAEKSDVFLHNFRQKAVEQLGLEYEALSRLNPRLVYAQVSGWGPKGPDKDDPRARFPAALGRSGFWSLITEPGRDCQVASGGYADRWAPSPPRMAYWRP